MTHATSRNYVVGVAKTTHDQSLYIEGFRNTSAGSSEGLCEAAGERNGVAGGTDAKEPVCGAPGGGSAHVYSGPAEFTIDGERFEVESLTLDWPKLSRRQRRKERLERKRFNRALWRAVRMQVTFVTAAPPIETIDCSVSLTADQDTKETP